MLNPTHSLIIVFVREKHTDLSYITVCVTVVIWILNTQTPLIRFVVYLLWIVVNFVQL